VTWDDDYGGRMENESREPSDFARALDREFREFRRDANAYRTRAETDLREAIEEIRNESTKTSRWVIGILVVIGVALGAGLIPNYVSMLQRLEHIAVRQDTIAEHGLAQDKALESMNSRLQIMEKFQWSGKP
jgi:hypothetical protein